MRKTKRLLLWTFLLLAAARPAAALIFVQDGFGLGPVANSTSAAGIVWSAYDSDDGDLAVWPGSATLNPRWLNWAQTDDGAGVSGFNRSASAFSNTQVQGTGAPAEIAIVLGDTVTHRGAQLPSLLGFTAAAFHPPTRKILLFGGRNSDGTMSNQIYEYDPVTDTLATEPTALPTARGGISAVYDPNSGSIFLFGGFTLFGNSVNEIYKYDPVGNSLELQDASMPSGRSRFSAAYDPGTSKIYIFGGSETVTNNYLNQILIYDPSDDSIVAASTQLPTGRIDSSAVYDSSSGVIYVFAGEDSTGFLDQIVRYNPATDARDQMSAVFPSTRARTAAAYSGLTEKIYIFGGSSGTFLSNEVIEFDPVLDTLAIRPAVLPSSRSFMAAAQDVNDKKIYLFGAGDGNTAEFNQILRYLYRTTETYTSSVFDTGTQSDLLRLTWNPAAQANSSVTLVIGFRSGDTPVPDATWSSGGVFQPAINGGVLSAFGDRRYMQYIASFTTLDVATSPVLHDIRIDYFRYSTSALLISSAFDAGDPKTILQQLNWQGAFPSGTTVQFQVRTASDNSFGNPGTWGPFLGPTGANDYYTSPVGSDTFNSVHGDVVDDRWFQFLAVLEATNTLNLPAISSVTIRYAIVPTSPTIQPLVALSTTEIFAQWIDNSTSEDEFIVSSAPTPSPTNTGALVATLDQGGTGALQSTTIGGLLPNTVYFVRMRAHSLPPDDLFSLFGPEENIFTLANIATSPVVNLVAGSSATISWSRNGNPPTNTPYEVSISSDDFSTSVSTPVVFADNLLAGSTVVVGLDLGTTWYFRIRAQNGNAIASSFSVIMTTQTPPASLTGFATSFVGASSMTWSWNSSGPAVKYRVYNGSTSILLATVGQTSYTRTGLAGSLPHSLQVEPFNEFSSDGLSPPTTAFTLAAQPNGLAVVFTSTDTVIVDWSENGNSTGTVYELSQSLDDFVTDFSTPVPFAAGLIISSATVFGLPPGTTLYYRVRAQNGDGINTIFTPPVSTQTLPGPIGVPSTTVLGVSSITWSWTNTAGPSVSSYDVFRASDLTFLGSFPVTSFIEVGLAPNVAYGVQVRAANNSGTGILSTPATSFTFAQPPTASVLSQVFSSSIVVVWSAGGNPPGTGFEVERATDNVQFALEASVSTDTATIGSLVGLTTHYFRVRARNGDGIATVYDVAVSTFLLGDPPEPPSNLRATPVGGNRIFLEWSISPTTTVVQYNLYTDNGIGGAVDYTVLFSSVPGGATTFMSVPLAPNTSYQFGLRAEDEIGVEELNEDVVAAAAAVPNLWELISQMNSPPAGAAVYGNHLSLLADLLTGTAANTKEVLFQYRPSSDTAWSDVVAVEFEHPNPATQPPFAVHWDATALTPGQYVLRAVSKNLADARDPFPPTRTVTVSPFSPDIEETDLGGGSIRTRLRLRNGSPAAVAMLDPVSNIVTEVSLASGALTIEPAILSLVSKPAGAPAVPSSLASPDIIRELTLDTGQTVLANGRRAVLRFSHLDRDGDNRVDGTTVRADNLAVFSYNTASLKWEIDFASSLGSADELSITAATPHLSFFGVFSAANTDLSRVRVYPVPFRPNNDDAEDGKTFHPADPTSGIVFDSLTGSTRIKIYTVNGSLVWESPPEIIGGTYQWDVRNGDGVDVASGVYFALITGPGSPPVIRKIAVIR